MANNIVLGYVIEPTHLETFCGVKRKFVCLYCRKEYYTLRTKSITPIKASDCDEHILLKCEICGLECYPNTEKEENRNPKCAKCKSRNTWQYHWPDGKITYCCESCGFDSSEEKHENT